MLEEGKTAAPAPAESYAAWLSDRRSTLETQLCAEARSESAWSWARLLTFLLALVAWYPFRSTPALGAAAVIGAIVFFAIAIVVHGRVVYRREMIGAELLVAAESDRRVGGRRDVVRWGSRPKENGADSSRQEALLPAGRTWALSGQERDDLDLYSAPLGLFGLLNRTSTDIGAARLRDDLEHSRLEKAMILSRQAAVRWLAEHPEERLHLLAALAGLRYADESLNVFAAAVSEAKPVMPEALALAARIWSVGGLALVAFAFARTFEGNHVWALAPVLLTLTNIALLSPFWARMRRWLARWEAARDFADGYLSVARIAVATLPRETELEQLNRAFEAVAAPTALGAATRWIHWAAGGGLMQITLNAFALYHMHMLERIHRHVAPHRDALRRGLSALAELESILSFACFAAEQPDVCWPEPVDEISLSIVGGKHPLIAPQHTVANDYFLGGEHRRLWLITGSNMSGKSTYLRTAGVNTVLAQAGGAVCARSMRFSPARIMTDLRIRDDLGRAESYFLAEVRQVRRMILPPDDSAPVLGLVDEPFRGTNHQEQRAATLAIIEHLAKSAGLFLIATHDRTVAAAVDGSAESFHFQEELGEKELVFDYRLRAGAAVSRNALRVLEREGYPPQLIARALQWAEDEGPQASAGA